MMLVAVAAAITYIGDTDDGFMLASAKSYVLQVNTRTNQMRMNNMFGFQMFPSVVVGGTAVTPSSPKAPVLTPGQAVNTFVVSYPENFANQVYASSTITLEDDYVQQTITLENTDANEEKAVEVEVVVGSTGPAYVYAPYKRNINAKYLLLSPDYNMEKAEAVIVAFDDLMPSLDQPLEVNVKQTMAKTMSWSIKLAAKSKQSINFKYRTGYITDEALLKQSPFNPPTSRQYMLDMGTDPIFSLQKKESLNDFAVQAPAGASATDVLNAIKDSIDKMPDAVTAITALNKTIDFADLSARKGASLSTVEKAVLFRELARKAGLPAELHLGVKGKEFYAWAIAYVGSSKFEFDPKGKKGEYADIYVEPELESCKGDDFASCPWAGGIRTDLVCVGDFCVSGFILIALAALAFILVFVAVQYKTDLVYQILGKKANMGERIQGSIAGTYLLVDEKYQPKNPLESAVYNELRRRSGAFSEIEYARTTGFTEPLVQSTVERFLDSGIIKKRY